jgi:hypothetical protein
VLCLRDLERRKCLEGLSGAFLPGLPVCLSVRLSACPGTRSFFRRTIR